MLKLYVSSFLLLSSSSFGLGQEICDEEAKLPRPNDKEEYIVGVMAIRGTESAFNDFNATFADYLTMTAGQRFDPPVSFAMLAVEPGTALDEFTAGGIDFVFANPSVSSCIDTEVGTNSLGEYIIYCCAASGALFISQPCWSSPLQ